MTQEVNKLAKMNVEVSLNDVVNVFVSKFEKGLIEKRNNLQVQIGGKMKEESQRKQEIEEEQKLILAEMFKKDFDYTITNNLFTCELEIKSNWREDKSKIIGCLTFKTKDRKSSWNGSMSITKEVEVKDETLDQIKADLAEMRKQLGLVIVELSTISIKEREIRGRISERNLIENGFQNILEDSDILKMIELK